MKLTKYLLVLLISFNFLPLINPLYSQERIKSISKTDEKILLIEDKKYTLIWSDEFDINFLDTNKWNYRALGKRQLGYLSSESIEISNGSLKINIFEKLKTYYSGMIGTQGKFEIKYGYFEAKINLQNEAGTQCAFWLQSPKYGEKLGDVAYSGAEIDIFEYIKNLPNTSHHTIHYDGYKSNHKKIYASSKIEQENKWHKFGLLWTTENYKFYVDGVLVNTVTEAISHTPQFVILSCEVTQWGGDISHAKLPDYFSVDYVRIYKNFENGNN